MATPDEINKKIQEEINKLSGSTKQHWKDILNNLDMANTSVEALEKLLDNIENEVEKINKELDYTVKIFDKYIEELLKGNKTLQYHNILLSKTNIITKETQDIRSGEKFANTSKIQSLQRENQLNIELLKNTKEQYLGEEKSLDLIQKKINELEKTKNTQGKLTPDNEEELKNLKIRKQQIPLIQGQITELEGVNKELKDISKHDKELNKELGSGTQLITKLFGGSKLFGSSLSDAYQTTIRLGQGAKAAGVKFNTAGVYTKLLGNNIKAALGPLAILTFLAEQLISVFSEVDKSTGQLAKDFNITYTQASNLRSELNEIAGLSGETAVNTRALQESMVAIGQSLGSNAKLNEKDLVFMTKMREMAGFTNEELVSMEKFTLATGGNLEDNTKNLMFAAKTTALNNKVLLNEKDIFRDISKTSNAVKLSIYGGAEALGRAAAQAKALGLNLDQVNNIASGLLDFESSISAELEAQLLTGRDINLEQARLYALNNDVEGLSREIAKNVGSIADFNQMNRLQQEAVAKAVGMQREELATMLVDREALKNLSGKDAEDAKKALAAARARGMTEEEIADSNIQDLMKQQSLQDRFNQSVEKLKEIFVGVAQSLMPVLDALAGVLEIVNLIVKPFAMLNQFAGSIHEYLKPLVAILTAVGVRMAVIAIRAKATAAANIIGLSAKTFGLGAIIALAGAGAGLTYLESNTKFAEGGIVTKPITNATVGEAGPEAIIPLNSPKADKYLGTDKSNTVIAGTGLNNKTNTTQTDNSSMISELREIKNILQKTYNLDLTQSSNKSSQTSGASLAMNIDRLGTTISTNTYKTQ